MTVLYNNVNEGLRVIEHENTRVMLLGNGRAKEQSGIYVDDLRKHFFDYSLLAMYSLLFVNKPKNILVVGCGGGIISREMIHYFPEVKIDIIDINDEMINIARDFFFFETNDSIRFIKGDGMQVVSSLKDQYDIIILDAFSKDYIPFHLMTKDFYKMTNDRLKEDGVSVMNTSSFHPSFYNQLNTIREAYGDNLYSLIGERNELTYMVYALKNDRKPLEKLDLPIEYYPKRIPLKIEITKEIKNSKIFEMKG